MPIKINAADLKARLAQSEKPVAHPAVQREGPVVHLKIVVPKEPPRLVVPPPYPRPVRGAQLRQATVLDYKPDGTPFIRSYVEGSGVTRPGDTAYENARASCTIFCTRKLGFQIALTACHHYCQSPCPDHLEAIQTIGWRSESVTPQYITSARRAEMQQERDRKKKGNDNGDG